MLKLKQRSNDDCFRTSVGCITYESLDTIPAVEPAILPEHLETVWNKWGNLTGYRFDISYEEPTGLSIVALDVSDLRSYGPGFQTAHSAVWKEGKGVVWNPGDESIEECNERDIYFWIEVRKVVE